MTRLFTAKIEPAMAHGIHHIAVAHIGAVQINPLTSQPAFKAQVGHHRSHQSATAKLSALGPARGDQSHELIAVGDLALFVNNGDPVCITVQADPNIGTML